LLKTQRECYPFRIVGIHTARHGTAYDDAEFGPAAASVEEFLDRAECEPALSHIRSAFARGRHVVTANKGPIAHAYAALRDEARQAGVEFRFESTVMDGSPVFNMVRETLPGVKVLGFTGILNSTSKIVIEAMREGKSLKDGIEEARRRGSPKPTPVTTSMVGTPPQKRRCSLMF
jgi:homoserine dehydrogenase